VFQFLDQMIQEHGITSNGMRVAVAAADLWILKAGFGASPHRGPNYYRDEIRTTALSPPLSPRSLPGVMNSDDDEQSFAA